MFHIFPIFLYFPLYPKATQAPKQPRRAWGPMGCRTAAPRRAGPSSRIPRETRGNSASPGRSGDFGGMIIGFENDGIRCDDRK